MAAASLDGWAELHCRSNFSFLEGASHPEELVNRAADLGYQALAITDRATISGMVRAHTVAKERGLKLIVGAHVCPLDAPALVLWAPDRAAYGRLCRLLTVGRRSAPKGECRLTLDDVAAFADGLLAGVSFVDPLYAVVAGAPAGSSLRGPSVRVAAACVSGGTELSQIVRKFPPQRLSTTYVCCADRCASADGPLIRSSIDDRT